MWSHYHITNVAADIPRPTPGSSSVCERGTGKGRLRNTFNFLLVSLNANHNPESHLLHFKRRWNWTPHKRSQETFKENNLQDLIEGFWRGVCVPDVTCGMLSEKAWNMRGKSIDVKKMNNSSFLSQHREGVGIVPSVRCLLRTSHSTSGLPRWSPAGIVPYKVNLTCEQ